MELAVAGLVAGTALSATGQIMAGKERSNAAAFEAEQLKGQQSQLQAQADNTRIAADQAETARREGLVANMEHIQSIRAGRGVGEGSPSGLAILDSLVSNTERDIGTERYNYLTKADGYRMSADNAGLASTMSARKAKTSLIAGYLDAGSTIAGAAFKYGSYKASGGISK